ncbi:MAG: DUF2721 domain-containing protein [Gammaproteobacteria bacterium]|nr:DUF2721 domain-containing protein [Gammaproteobacteria bacterium]MBU1416482.1 DUF2721 domain-containing protein [Gammaproteobacteria bacterium]
MQSLADITDVAHVIQLAVAPVFLLTGIGAILSVLINRLGRVVDRFRTLENLLPGASDTTRAAIKVEMKILAGRARMVHWAIGFCTSSALLVCIVIATLFVGSVTGAQMPGVIAILFIAAMLALVVGLLCFLREIALAKGSIHTVPR